MNVNTIIAGNLKRYREKCGMTQEDAAKLLEIKPQNLSSMERGKRTISYSMVDKICKLFAVSPEEMFHLNDHTEMIEEMLHDEITKMDKSGKAKLYSYAVAINSGKE